MLNNPYPLTKEQRDAYKKLLNKALEFFGFNKNYFIGYYRKYKGDPGYLTIIKKSSYPSDHISKIKFEAMLDSFEKKGLIAYEYMEADFKIDDSIEKKEIIKINEIESIKEFKNYLYNGLIFNENLTTEKRFDGKDLFLEVLKLYDLGSNFRVDIYPHSVSSDFIYLREATQPKDIPNEEKKARFKTMLQDLAQNKLITYKKHEAVFKGETPNGTSVKQTMQVEKIEEINLVELETFLENKKFLKKVLNSSLKHYQLEAKYRIANDRKYFRLRPSTQNSPSKNDQENFQTLMSLLTEIGLITYESKNIPSPNSFFVGMQASIITQVDRKIIDSYQQIEERILYDKKYAKLDFAPITWLYIDYCFNKNLARDNPGLDTACLDSAYQDSMSISTALECPVVLPSSKDRIYDLKNILKFIPFEDPFTRQVFELSDIKPAPGGLKVLEKKIAAIQNPKQGIEEARVAEPSYRR
ncbi:hypothetical protein [Rickettsiella endosymbiont of Rhagonycha lignosa]|uniref:hypothetical protein n=1 Tax=Rickettsiella endosymbiont of Rhagonycha lignosa TaxID=3077937 RepID=UPI00313D1508